MGSVCESMQSVHFFYLQKLLELLAAHFFLKMCWKKQPWGTDVALRLLEGKVNNDEFENRARRKYKWWEKKVSVWNRGIK